MKRLNDDEVMDYAFNRVFGDLDGIRSRGMFSDADSAVNGSVPNAGTPGVEGIDITIKPKMAAAAEGGRSPESGDPAPANPEEEEEEDDKLKGIGRMSSLMYDLHGDR